MKESSNPLPSTIRLSVKLTDGHLTMADGTALPVLRKGTTGELHISPFAIEDENERTRLSCERPVPFLPKETKLWARVKQHGIPADLVKEARQWPIPNSGPHPFVVIELKQDLTLMLNSGRHSYLNECACFIPSLKKEAKSVNEAYTLVSTAFEPARRSHTGNVFLCVYREKDGRLHS